MKILHISTSGEYTDGFSYQDNLLAKYMVRLGWEVYQIASPLAYDENGQAVWLPVPQSYVNADGVHVTRLPYRKPTFIRKKLRSMKGFYAYMEQVQPDYIWFHLPQSSDSAVVIRYLKKHPNVRLYCDNHADFSNSATNFLSRKVLHGIIWRHYLQKLIPYTEKFYGVLPARVDFLKNVYGIPAEKCDLLVMGGEDELTEAAARPESRHALREQYGLSDDDFVVVTGGKIDRYKTQTLLLMQAVRNIGDPRLKLLVFGSVDKTLQPQVDALCDGKTVQYIGWVHPKDTYRYFGASDLAVFPGRHSVFWGQVAAQGIPMLCKWWQGTDDIDLGGNMRFLTEDSAAEIEKNLRELLDDPERYAAMKKVAVEKGMKTYSYTEIAKRAIVL